METIVIVSYIGWIVTVILGLSSSEDKTVAYIFASITLAIIAVVSTLNYGKPEAIDVYRGKTTLEITYRGDISTDTVVVFK